MGWNNILKRVDQRTVEKATDTHRMVPEKRTGSCVMMDSLERSCSKPTCDTSIPSTSMRPPHFSVRRNRAATNDDLPNIRKKCIIIIRPIPVGGRIMHCTPSVRPSVRPSIISQANPSADVLLYVICALLNAQSIVVPYVQPIIKFVKICEFPPNVKFVETRQNRPLRWKIHHLTSSRVQSRHKFTSPTSCVYPTVSWTSRLLLCPAKFSHNTRQIFAIVVSNMGL